VFSRSHCPYCLDAKELLKKKNIVFSSIELDEVPMGRLIQEELFSLTGHWTVPNIFLKGKHIGGCNDLHALNDSGGLLPLYGKNAKQVVL
jgi:glutaredoxin